MMEMDEHLLSTSYRELYRLIGADATLKLYQSLRGSTLILTDHLYDRDLSRTYVGQHREEPTTKLASSLGYNVRTIRKWKKEASV